ncbi:MAG: hypothetical protein ACI97A_003523 [Planctomycetota bacterium]|jgi:hypothetical protein
MFFVRGRWYKTVMVDTTADKSDGAEFLSQVAQHLHASRDNDGLDSRLDLASPQFFSDSLQEFSCNRSSSSGSENQISFELIDSKIDPGMDDEALFSTRFESFSSLPDAAPRALIHVIWNAASIEPETNLFFHYWLSEKLRSWLGPRGFCSPGNKEAVASLRREAQRMLTMGINLRRRVPADFLAARYAISDPLESSDLDGGAILNTIVSCASFAGAGLLETLDVMTLSPPSPGPTCAIFGLLAGRFYGKKRLMALETHGQKLEAYFITPEGG